MTRDAGATAATGKAKSGFAGARAAAQDQDPETAPQAPRETPSARVAAGADTATAPRTADDADEIPVLVNDLFPAPPTDPPTPWLLLALAVGGWSDAAAPTETVQAEAAPDGAANLVSPLLDAGPATTLIAVPPVQAAAAAEPSLAPVNQTVPVFLAQQATTPVATSVPATTPSEPVLPGSATPTPSGLATAAPPVARAAGGASALEPAVSGAAIDIGEAPPPVEGSAGEVVPAPPTEEGLTSLLPDLARWRAARRGAGEAGELSLPAIASDRQPGQVPVVAPGPAVSRLAQALGRVGDRPAEVPAVAVGTGTAMPVTAADPTGPPAPVASGGARAAEALLRLSQAATPGGRKGLDAGAGAAAFAHMLSTAMPSPTEAAAAPVAPPMPPLPATTGEHVLAQVVSSLRLQWKDGVGEAKLHLRPDALGHVSVALKVEGGAVTAVVKAENPQVQEWILQHQPSLRQQLEAAGLHLDELVVSPDDQRQSKEHGGRDAEDPPQRRSPRRTDDSRLDGPRFETLL
jgi:hypothetical protein